MQTGTPLNTELFSHRTSVRIHIAKGTGSGGKDDMTTRSELQGKSIKDLREIAAALQIDTAGLQKAKLIGVIIGADGFEGSDEPAPVELPAAERTTAPAAKAKEDKAAKAKKDDKSDEAEAPADEESPSDSKKSASETDGDSKDEAPADSKDSDQ